MKIESTDNSPLLAAAARFAALGSEQRLAVLLCLVRAGPKGLSIGVLGDRSGVSGSTLTFHTKILVQAGLVRQTRNGRQIICAADTAAIEALSDLLVSECCADAPPIGADIKDAEHG